MEANNETDYNAQQQAEQEAEARLEEEICNEVNKVSENMQKHGGSFVQSLGIALSHADMINAIRIKEAFPEYWEEYKNL